MTCAEQVVIDVLPSMKLTVPVAPAVNHAVTVTGVPTFCGDTRFALRVIVVAAFAGVVTTMVPAGPVPPALEAVTLKVTEVAAAKLGTVQERLVGVGIAPRVHVCPPGLAVTV